MARKIAPHKGGRTIKKSLDVTPETNKYLATLAKSLGDLVEEATRKELYMQRQSASQPQDMLDLPEIENPLFDLPEMEKVYHAKNKKSWEWRETYQLVCREMVRRMQEHHADWRYSYNSEDWFSWTSAVGRTSHDLPNTLTFSPSDTANDARQAREATRQAYAEEAKRVKDEVAPKIALMSNDELKRFIALL